MGVELVVVGASLGGVEALSRLLGALPKGFGVPVAVVQHRHRFSDDALLSALQPHTPLHVCEPDDKEPMEAGSVYMAPADYHLLAATGWFELSTEAPVHHARPSVDVLFESAADAYGAGVVAVVLTGANADGARGATAVRDRGGVVIVQDAATAEAPQMPGAAVQAGAAHHVCALDEIAPLLVRLCDARPDASSS